MVIDADKEMKNNFNFFICVNLLIADEAKSILKHSYFLFLIIIQIIFLSWPFVIYFSTWWVIIHMSF